MFVIIMVITAVLLVASFLINFYRDPERIIPPGDNIVAPADGKVISIIDTSDDGIRIRKGLIGKVRVLTRDIGKDCIVISIFMSPSDVHVNRSPISGTVTKISHTKGRFFRADNLEKSLENEKNEILIENEKTRVEVIQIAGFLARRIKCWVKVNQKINKGGKVGMISLGSQASLVLRKGVSVKVKVGERVKAGETIVAA